MVLHLNFVIPAAYSKGMLRDPHRRGYHARKGTAARSGHVPHDLATPHDSAPL